MNSNEKDDFNDLLDEDDDDDEGSDLGGFIAPEDEEESYNESDEVPSDDDPTEDECWVDNLAQSDVRMAAMYWLGMSEEEAEAASIDKLIDRLCKLPEATLEQWEQLHSDGIL